MRLLNSESSYGLISIILHWLIAFTTFGLFGLGLWMTGLGYYDAWYNKAPRLHESIGVLVFLCLLLRLSWRLLTPLPHSLNTHSRLEKIGAKSAHHLMNTLLFFIAISGYLIVTAKGKSLSVFGWFELPAMITNIDNLEDISGKIHYYLACIIIFIAAIHAMAAIKHHFIDKDTTLKRMLGL